VLENGQEVVAGVKADYPVHVRDRVGIEIETRVPGTGGEPTDAEPAVARTITFTTAADEPLNGFNAQPMNLRRYFSDWVNAEIGTNDRLSGQLVDLAMKTGPVAEGEFPVGPEFSLSFSVSNPYVYPAIAIGLLSAIAGALGWAAWKDNVVLGIFLIGIGIIGVFMAYALFFGRVKLPGGGK
jgi:hypothetical protein